ncbi:hypothetical protein SAMN04489732_102622 [Amycolatopsis saalfeldensis]|uniref:Uncharacterized protein n=1 Tax=Amycolatopsis saalfeldensis TaxID=394193 RepID=A0A1H8TH41_9PSEU|nr:hypothetical protein SAMN04489732_102622 [Amycolatopsis saalfeldensis]
MVAPRLRGRHFLGVGFGQRSRDAFGGGFPLIGKGPCGSRSSVVQFSSVGGRAAFPFVGVEPGGFRADAA